MTVLKLKFSERFLMIFCYNHTLFSHHQRGFNWQEMEAGVEKNLIWSFYPVYFLELGKSGERVKENDFRSQMRWRTSGEYV